MHDRKFAKDNVGVISSALEGPSAEVASPLSQGTEQLLTETAAHRQLPLFDFGTILKSEPSFAIDNERVS